MIETAVRAEATKTTEPQPDDPYYEMRLDQTELGLVNKYLPRTEIVRLLNKKFTPRDMFEMVYMKRLTALRERLDKPTRPAVLLSQFPIAPPLTATAFDHRKN
jgi:hypothetical protein